METVADFILGGSQITADGDCNHEIKRYLLLGRKAMSNLDNILKSRDITFPTNVRLVSSVLFSHSVVSDSLPPHEPWHARPPCPSPTRRVYQNSCPLSWWCYTAIWSSVVPFSSHPQCFPESGSFKWVSSSHQVSKVLEFQLQHQSFQWTPRTDLL